jgi:uncharacterized membrane-anchored protein YhcB (DUF1043 family)
MALPIVAGILLTGLGGYGIKKGFDAKEKLDEANEIVKKYTKKFEKKKRELEEERESLNRHFERFAEYKLKIFTTDFKNFIKFMKECKPKAKSTLENEKLIMTKQEFQELENIVINSLEISSGLAKGIASGALTALGAYGSVGALASASTGTAIATLSGAAATNATLAWLGGGSIAAGGFGIAGGTLVLGGLVTAPLLAVTGFMMDSKAEENLTKAYEFKKEAKKQIKEIEKVITEIEIIKNSIFELEMVIDETRKRFQKVFKRIQNSSNRCSHKEIDTLLGLAMELKALLALSILDKNGKRNLNLEQEIKRIVLK